MTFDRTATVPPRYVLALSARSAEALTAYSRRLAVFLAGAQQPARKAFAHTTTLEGVAATLLNFRSPAPHRLAFDAASLSEAADKLAVFSAHPGNPKLIAAQNVYGNVVEWSPFDDEKTDAHDRDYLSRLAQRARHDQIAKLWTVGFPVDWRHVYPNLAAERPIYLPPAPLDRRRYWPHPESVPSHAKITQPQPVPRNDATIGTVAAVAGGAPAHDAAVAGTEPPHSPRTLRAELAGLPTALRVRRVCGYLQERIAAVLDYPAGEHPNVDSGFFDLGMSSIQLEQVRQQIHTDTGFEPGETSAFDHPTIAEFAAYLTGELADGDRPVSPASPAPASPDALVVHRPAPVLSTLDEHTIDELSARDLERVLSEVLS